MAGKFHQKAVPGEELVGRVVRLVLPYRAELHDLPRKVQEYLGDRSRLLKNAVGMTMGVQICWSKAGKTIA